MTITKPISFLIKIVINQYDRHLTSHPSIYACYAFKYVLAKCFSILSSICVFMFLNASNYTDLITKIWENKWYIIYSLKLKILNIFLI